MRRSSVWAARVVVVLFFLAAASRLQAETKIPDASAPPAALVKAALESELDGPSELRHTLLEQALKRDPNFAPARWQSGFVRWDGGWLHVDEVPKRVVDDKSLAEYRKRRDGMVDTADNHRALAKWCRKNKLVDEERIHWAKVLEFESGDAEALAALGLQVYNGRMLTRQQIEQEKKLAGERLRATQHWQPQIVKWRNAIERGSQKDRDAALEKLRTLSDPGAIAPLEAIFAVNGDSKHAVELNLLLIDTVSRMPFPEATQVLLRRAIVPDPLEIRTAAANQLKKRPMQAYVPHLIALFSTDAALAEDVQIETTHYFYPGFLAGHDLFHVAEVRLQGESTDRQMFFITQNVSFLQPGKLPYLAGLGVRLLDHNLQVAAQAADAQKSLAKIQISRIQSVLAQAAGFQNADSLHDVIQEWDRYTGSYSPPSMGIYNPGAQTPEFHFYYRQMSCFPAGTSVWTLAGAIPIEKIAVGDHVLSQDCQTGELTYKSVQAVTLRPPISLLKLNIGSESIRVTPGHLFWVNGQGWQMAKQLKVGAPLHALDGAVMVDSIEEDRPLEAYNLVVSDFNSYFVGDHRLLVHDNLPLRATPELVPGLAADVSVGK